MNRTEQNRTGCTVFGTHANGTKICSFEHDRTGCSVFRCLALVSMVQNFALFVMQNMTEQVVLRLGLVSKDKISPTQKGGIEICF